MDQHNMEMKLWPRSAAFAERLWSSPKNRSNSVYPRLLHHRARMVRRGIHADRLQPESCHQISGYCSDPSSRLWNKITLSKYLPNAAAASPQFEVSLLVTYITYIILFLLKHYWTYAIYMSFIRNRQSNMF